MRVMSLNLSTKTVSEATQKQLSNQSSMRDVLVLDRLQASSKISFGIKQPQLNLMELAANAPKNVVKLLKKMRVEAANLNIPKEKVKMCVNAEALKSEIRFFKLKQSANFWGVEGFKNDTPDLLAQKINLQKLKREAKVRNISINENDTIESLSAKILTEESTERTLLAGLEQTEAEKELSYIANSHQEFSRSAW